MLVTDVSGVGLLVTDVSGIALPGSDVSFARLKLKISSSLVKLTLFTVDGVEEFKDKTQQL